MPPLAALFAWPVISTFLFQRYRLPVALIVTILAGFLLLPEGVSVDLSLLPALNKNTITVLSALVLALAFAKRDKTSHVLPGLLIPNRFAIGMICLLVFGAFMTVLTNGDPLVYGPRYLPGMQLYDAFSSVLGVIMLMLPLILGRKYLARTQDHRLLLICLCYAGLAYSFLALFEIRMSPQINRMVYGFFPHEWRQHVRGGGFRPLVFLRHGLVLAIFFSFCIIASFGLARIIPERKGFFIFTGLWIMAVLVLSNSLGGLLITLVLVPLVWWLPRSTQLLGAFVIAVAFLSYPFIRSNNIVPVDTVMSGIERISEERAQSFGTRLRNEDLFLEKINDRPLFGWGGWGRSRIFDERGRDLTIADGHWIIQLSIGGWARYLSEMGLFAGPIILLFLRRRRDPISPETIVLTVILAANMVDLVPNTSLTPISLLIAGALWGRLELGAEGARDATAPQTGGRQETPPYSGGPQAPPEPAVARSRYTRQTGRVYQRGTKPR